MATNAQVISALQSLIAAVTDNPSGGDGAKVDFIEVNAIKPIHEGGNGNKNVVGVTAELPEIISPRDIVVINGVLTIRVIHKYDTTTMELSADTVIPVAVTCVAGIDGKSIRAALPPVVCKRPSFAGEYLRTTVVAWTPTATARYSQ